MSGEVKTFEELKRWIQEQADTLGGEAKDQQVNSDFDLLRIRCIYAEHLAKIALQALNHTLTLLQEKKP